MKGPDRVWLSALLAVYCHLLPDFSLLYRQCPYMLSGTAVQIYKVAPILEASPASFQRTVLTYLQCYTGILWS